MAFRFCVYSQMENRALRLRESATASMQYMDDLQSTSPVQLQLQQHHSMLPMAAVASSDPRPSWDYFDEAGYIQRGGLRTGEDPYVRNRFNQMASDLLPSNRNIPDTRNQM